MTHAKNIIFAGLPVAEATKAVIMLHGRGASADDILSLSSHLNIGDSALIAPQATNNSWYPYSFLAPRQQNEPWLSSGLDIIDHIVTDLVKNGIAHQQIYLVGFSQGACLALEYVARNPKRYGGVAAFTGGLIGDSLELTQYHGDFAATPIFIGTGNPDSHVPLERVHQTVTVLENQNAEVTLRVYDGRPHTISKDEIGVANQHVFK